MFFHILLNNDMQCTCSATQMHIMETRTQERSSQIQTHHHAWPRRASVVSWCPDMLLVRQILIFMCLINCLLHILHFISFFEPPPYLLVKFIEHRTRFLTLPKLTEFLCRQSPLWKSYFCARFAFNWRQSVSSFEVRLKSTGFDRIVFNQIDWIHIQCDCLCCCTCTSVKYHTKKKNAT